VQLDGGMLDPMWKKGTRIRIWLLGLDWQSLPDDATA
jgi:6-phosphogluconate dehydrogenase (decarboxylating)